MSEKLIITMTTWRKRIDNLPVVIDSILNQTKKPDKIVINLSEEEFANKEKDIPKNVLDYLNNHKHIVEIYWCGKNIRTWKKIIPTLKRYPNDAVLCMDDDWIYNKNYIEKLWNKHLEFPNNPVVYTTVTNHGFYQHCGIGTIDKACYYDNDIDKWLNTEIVDIRDSDSFMTFMAVRHGNPPVSVGEDGVFNAKSYNPVEPFAGTMGPSYDWISKKLNDCFENYKKIMTRWVIHWWVRERETLDLTETEMFHFSELKKYTSTISLFDKITVSLSLDDVNNLSLINFAKSSFLANVKNKNVEFIIIQNNPASGEFKTYRDQVLSRIDSGEYILYTHFKGARANAITNVNMISQEKRWCSDMYSVVMGCNSINIIKKRYLYGDKRQCKRVSKESELQYRTEEINHINRLFRQDNPYRIYINKQAHSRWRYYGSFMWINTSLLYEHILDEGINKQCLLNVVDTLDKNGCSYYLSENFICDFSPYDGVCHSECDMQQIVEPDISNSYVQNILTEKKVISRAYVNKKKKEENKAELLSVYGINNSGFGKHKIIRKK
jgi:hypothetical protein